MRAVARTLPRPVGLVPTMGALHDGHLALVRRARAENAAVVASLFVNPLQFAPNEDFERYPRSFDRDAALFEAAGVELLYAPAVAQIYPAGFSTTVDVGVRGAQFEGAVRAGHFAGVATIVAKLLHAVEPTSLYLGQKDAQQTVVLRRMIADLDLPVSVVVAPTVREPDGLALSSRNVYLTTEQRAAAPSLQRALAATREALAGGASIADAKAAGRAQLLPPFAFEYLEVVDPTTFVALDRPARPAIVIGAARAGERRLLDNVTIPALDGTDPVLTPVVGERRTAQR